MKTLTLSTILGAGLLMMGGVAQAQSTWTMTSGCAQAATNSGTFGNSYNCNGAVVSGPGNKAAGTTVNVTGWSTDKGTKTWEADGISSGGTSTQRSTYKTIYTQNPANGNKYDWVTYVKSSGAVYASGSGTTAVAALPNTTTYAVKSREQAAPAGAGTWFANAQLTDNGGSGFGAISRVEIGNSPNHAVDSTAPGTTDMVLLKFDTAVVLSQFGVGWAGNNEGDVTLLRWTGTSAPASLTSATAPAMGGATALDGTKKDATHLSGWEIVSSYDVTGTGNVTTNASVASSWWLVSTYNTSIFGSSTCLKSNGTAGGTCDAGDDSFKLNFLKTTNYTCPNNGNLGSGGVCTPPSGGGGSVPEPGSLALAAFAGAALLARRRQTRGAQAQVAVAA